MREVEKRVEGEESSPTTAREDEPSQTDAYNAEGVDMTQVRASLARTPLERLRENEDGVRLLEQLRRARR